MIWLVPLFAGAIFLGVMIVGLVTGKMPTRGEWVERKNQPVAFWLIGAMSLGLSLYFLSQALSLWRKG